MDKNTLISRDRLRYSKNKFSAVMAYLAILFNAIYFASIYKGVESYVDKFYFDITMGASVLINIIFMLIAFLASEGVKNYKMKFAVTMFVLAGLQIFRIFGYPMSAHGAFHPGHPADRIMNDSQQIFCIIMLIASAASLVAGGVIATIRTGRLKLHQSFVDKNGGKVNFEEADNAVPLVDVTNNTDVDASVMGEEPIKQEKSDKE